MEDANIREAEEQVTNYNIGLAVIQLFCGMQSGSAIMLADSLYSAYHAFGGVQEGMNRRKERIVSGLLTLMFLVVAITLSIVNIQRIISGRYLIVDPPGLIVILLCGVSMLLKKMLGRHLIYQALEYNSSILVADAWHQRQDFIVFAISGAGLCLAKMGLLWAEPVTSIIVCILFFRNALVL